MDSWRLRSSGVGFDRGNGGPASRHIIARFRSICSIAVGSGFPDGDLMHNVRMKSKSTSDQQRYIGMGLGVGIAIGTAIGIAMGNLALGLGPGIAIGLGMGAALSRKAAAAGEPKEP